MGKMKDLVIDQMNSDRNGPDDTDWNAPTFDGAGFTEADNQLDPPPDVIDTTTNKCMWKIKSLFIDDVTYKIWASSYKEALKLLPLIEDF
jgi:hypothetical protein